MTGKIDYRIVVRDDETRPLWRQWADDSPFNGCLASQLVAGEAEPAARVVIVDLRPNEEPDVARLVSQVREHMPDAELLVIASSPMERQLAIEAGAEVCIAKSKDYGPVWHLAEMMMGDH
jgi:hypothetical protein